MRVHLKGVHKVTVKLAGGTTATYFYAWRKGPRLIGEPGSPEFVASYYAAHQSRRAPDRSRFHSIIAGYKASQDFHGLKPRTRTDYLQHIARIETEFGDLPLAALEDARVTRDFLELARRHGAQPATGGLWLDGPDAAVVLGASARAHALPAA